MYLRKRTERSDLQPAAELVPVLHLSRSQHNLSSPVVDSLVDHPAGDTRNTANKARVQQPSPVDRKPVGRQHALYLFFYSARCSSGVSPHLSSRNVPPWRQLPLTVEPFISSTHTHTQTLNLAALHRSGLAPHFCWLLLATTFPTVSQGL